jgi:hypothetical protein
MINWKASKSEYSLAAEIAKRATELYEEVEGPVSQQQSASFHRSTLMDIIAVHANGCPLRLQELLRASRFEFSHDVFGIRRHLNRETGQLGDYFLPRFAVPLSAPTSDREASSQTTGR